MSAPESDRKERHEADWFLFPYEAYPIQVDLMNSIYQAIEHRQIGLFESPTGTGKSLSLLCGAMKWLRSHQSNPLILELQEATETVKEPKQVPQWILDLERKKQAEADDWKRKDHQRVHEAYQSRLRKVRDAMHDRSDRENRDFSEPNSKRPNSGLELKSQASTRPAELKKVVEPSQTDSQFQDNMFLLDDYDSDAEKITLSKYDEDRFESLLDGPSVSSKSGISFRGAFGSQTSEEDELKDFPTRKIFFCSRTHSQLSQFIHEIRKTHWANDLRLVVLGSRKTLCINSSVNQLPTMNQINEKCLDLVNAKASTLPSDSRGYEHSGTTEFNDSFGLVPVEAQTSMCRYLHELRQQSFRDHILADPKDIEELLEMGKKGAECPYFATRSSIQNAEIVVLPYNTLLHQGTREALGIDLKGNIIILDEAHNLIDTLNSIHSVELTLSKIGQALSQLNTYLEKFRSRLKQRNITYIEKIRAILSSLIKYIDPPSAHSTSSDADNANVTKSTTGPSKQPQNFGDESGASASIVGLNDFLFDARLDQYNLFKIERYLKESGIVQKVQGYCQSNQIEISVVKTKKTIQLQLDETEFEKHRPALGIVSQFLLALTSKSSDGCILVSRHRAPSNPKNSSLKYVSLNSEVQFQTILKEARSVIMAGGTMQPFGDFYQHLLSGDISSEHGAVKTTSDNILTPTGASMEMKNEISFPRIATFTCSHIIPDSNLTTVIFPSGPSGVEFNFTHENMRNHTDALFDEAAALVQNICNIVPDGVVLFSPSYQFEERFISRLKVNGVYENINSRKPIFREPRSSSGVDLVLSEYESCILKNVGETGGTTGALLSCVVGGKLSEGINFKDHLGRCVIVLGLPFPNSKDPILMERLAHINLKASTASKSDKTDTMTAASSAEYYENLCMKAVNQSIGRSIRHIGDYATIVLVDKRYNKASIQSKLPLWIRHRLTPNSSGSFGEGFRSIVQFFRSKDSNQKAIQANRLREEKTIV